MKKYIKKLNQIGAAHLLAPLLVTALIAGVGVYVLNKSRAATDTSQYSSTPLLYSYADYANPAKIGYYIKTTSTGGTNTLTQAAQTSDKYFLSNGKYSPDKSQIAYTEAPNGTTTSTIKIKSLNTFVVKPPKVFSDGVSDVAQQAFRWSPDGKRIIYLTDTLPGNIVKFKALDVNTGSVAELATVSTAFNGGNWTIYQFDMLGDNQTIVYSLDNSIYQVKANPPAKSNSGSSISQVKANPSTSSPAESNNGNCVLVGRRPGTTTEFAYTCYSETARTNTLYTKTLTTTEKVVYASSAWSWNNGVTNRYLEDVAWSQNGAQLAMARTNETIIDNETCLVKRQPSMDVINADGTGFRTLANTDDSKTVGPGCGGQGGMPDGARIVWSKSGNIAVLTDSGIKVIGAASPYSVTTVFKRPNNATFIRNLDW